MYNGWQVGARGDFRATRKQLSYAPVHRVVLVTGFCHIQPYRCFFRCYQYLRVIICKMLVWHGRRATCLDRSYSIDSISGLKGRTEVSCEGFCRKDVRILSELGLWTNHWLPLASSPGSPIFFNVGQRWKIREPIPPDPLPLPIDTVSGPPGYEYA